MPACALDHLVIAAATLDEGADFVRERLGVEIGPGGAHPLMGTHNRLMRLGDNAFLEVIAIDPDAPDPGRARWYALDDPEMQAQLRSGPRLITWVVRALDIVGAVQSVAISVGEVTSVSRGNFSWRLTVPRDGRLPGGGVIPHMIEWDCGARPWEDMAEAGCDLERLVLAHPQPEWVAQTLKAVCSRGYDFVEVTAGETPSLSARIVTPGGIATI